ncbi:MAG: FAD-dependent oxidoreductase [Bacteroidales bacterium]
MLQEMQSKYIMAPIKLGYTNGNGIVNDRHLKFYTNRSSYLGAVIPEPLYLNEGLRELPTQLGIDKDDKIEGLKRLTDMIHSNGSKAIAHLNHPGRMANPKLEGNYHVSSSDKACEKGGATPKAMEQEEMKRALQQFTSAAVRAEKAGFDSVELQFGHGYLLAQFISPAVNYREDGYGGSFENRIKFPLEVFDAAKESVNIPIIGRISGDEMSPGGIKPNDMIKFSQILEEKGIEAIHVSAGSICSTPPWFFQHMFIPKGKTWEPAREIKQHLRTPVIFVGQINSREDLDMLDIQYKADYVAVGRGLIADPDFIGKYLGEVEGNIRPCLACAEGCLGSVKAGKGLNCLVNPLVGNDMKEPEMAEEKKSYAVVGGGLAGMEAALTLNRRGHDVVIYEKENLGGQFNLASLPPKKGRLKEIVDYYKTEIMDKRISILYREADIEEMKNNGYDGVVLATGAKPAIPPVQGLNNYYWTEFLDDENLPENQTILVIGGGMIGTEVTSKLVEKNSRVIIVEMLDEIARGMEMIERQLTLSKLQQNKVETFTNYKVKRVEGDKVVIEGGGSEKVLEGIDKIVVTAGIQSHKPLQHELEQKIPVYVIGDAKKVGKAKDAISDGFQIASAL